MRSLYKLEIKNFVEIDKFAEASYCAIHGVDKSLNLGDITKVDPKKLPKGINVIVGGSPCTSFSTAGKQDGSTWFCNDCGKKFDPLEIDNLDNCCCPDCKSTDLLKTESSLIVDWLRIFKEVTPKLAIFENVKNLLSKRFEKSFKLFEKRIQELGYNTYYKCMNAKDYGIPQNRERVIFLAIRKDVDNGKFKFPEPCGLKLTINDMLEENLDIYKHTDSNIIIDNKISPYIRKHIDRDTNEIITSDKGIYRMKCTSGFNDNAVGIQFVPTLRARNSSTIALQTYDTLQGKKYYIKRLTPLEAFRFMGFSDEDYLAAAKVNCKTQLYKQCGNSIVVNVVEEVLRALFKAMPKLFEDVQIIDLFAGIGAFEKAFKKVIDDANDRYIVPVVSDTDKFIDDYNNSIFNGDCIEIMKSMSADSVSMTLTDIPYAECKKASNGLRVIDKKNANTETFDLLTFIKEVDRVTQGIIVIFCGMEQYSTIFKYFAQKQNKHLGTVRGICWAKTNPSPMNGQNIYLSGMELAVWYKPKGVKFNGYCKSNVFMFPCGKSKLHPTEKNYKLITELILDNTQTGDVVFDPCCGSGTHLLCAKENNRQYVGIELDADYYKIAQKRLL